MRHLAIVIFTLALFTSSRACAVSGLGGLSVSLVIASAMRETAAVNARYDVNGTETEREMRFLDYGYFVIVDTLRSHDKNRAIISRSEVYNPLGAVVAIVQGQRIGFGEVTLSVHQPADASWAHLTKSSSSTGGNDSGSSGDSM